MKITPEICESLLILGNGNADIGLKLLVDRPTYPIDKIENRYIDRIHKLIRRYNKDEHAIREFLNFIVPQLTNKRLFELTCLFLKCDFSGYERKNHIKQFLVEPHWGHLWLKCQLLRRKTAWHTVELSQISLHNNTFEQFFNALVWPPEFALYYQVLFPETKAQAHQITQNHVLTQLTATVQWLYKSTIAQMVKDVQKVNRQYCDQVQQQMYQANYQALHAWLMQAHYSENLSTELTDSMREAQQQARSHLFKSPCLYECSIDYYTHQTDRKEKLYNYYQTLLFLERKLFATVVDLSDTISRKSQEKTPQDNDSTLIALHQQAVDLEKHMLLLDKRLQPKQFSVEPAYHHENYLAHLMQYFNRYLLETLVDKKHHYYRFSIAMHFVQNMQDILWVRDEKPFHPHQDNHLNLEKSLYELYDMLGMLLSEDSHKSFFKQIFFCAQTSRLNRFVRQQITFLENQLGNAVFGDPLLNTLRSRCYKLHRHYGSFWRRLLTFIRQAHHHDEKFESLRKQAIDTYQNSATFV